VVAVPRQYDANGSPKNAAYQTGPGKRLLSDGRFRYTFEGQGNRPTRTRIFSAAADDYLTTRTQALEPVRLCTGKPRKRGQLTAKVAHGMSAEVADS
jgi:hypothetical protein